MPRHLSKSGSSVEYHPLVIRFTANQFAYLNRMKDARNKSINEIIRSMADREISVFIENLSSIN